MQQRRKWRGEVSQEEEKEFLSRPVKDIENLDRK